MIITLIPSDSNIVTPKIIKKQFHDNCNSIKAPFSDEDHHGHVDSKYCDTNVPKQLKIKEKHFGIIHLNTASLNKQIDDLWKSLAQFQIPNHRLI